MPELVVGVCGGQLQLHDETVHLVDADGDGQTLLDGMLDQPFRVQHHLHADREAGVRGGSECRDDKGGGEKPGAR